MREEGCSYCNNCAACGSQHADTILELKEQLELAIRALEQVNQEELNSQRPGGGYSKSARISYEALQKLTGLI